MKRDLLKFEFGDQQLTESARHKAWKNVLCGCGSETEVQFGPRRRLDCANLNLSTCGEVELNRRRIPRDVGKLSAMRSSGTCDNPVLAVKSSDYQYARGLAKKKAIQVVDASAWNLGIRQASCSLKKRIELL